MEGHISAAELWAIGGIVVLLVVAALGSLLGIRIDGLSKPVEPSNASPSNPSDLDVPPS
jgi:hypothetical protein